MFRMSASGSAVSTSRSAGRPRGAAPKTPCFPSRPPVVPDRARAGGVEDRGGVQGGAGLDQAVVEPAYRVRSRIESVEPAPEPPPVFERPQLRRLRQVKSRRGKLSEDVDVLDRIDTGERRLDSGGGVLVHQDGNAASGRARA